MDVKPSKSNWFDCMYFFADVPLLLLEEAVRGPKALN